MSNRNLDQYKTDLKDAKTFKWWIWWMKRKKPYFLLRVHVDMRKVWFCFHTRTQYLEKPRYDVKYE